MGSFMQVEREIIMSENTDNFVNNPNDEAPKTEKPDTEYDWTKVKNPRDAAQLIKKYYFNNKGSVNTLVWSALIGIGIVSYFRRYGKASYTNGYVAGYTSALGDIIDKINN